MNFSLTILLLSTSLAQAALATEIPPRQGSDESLRAFASLKDALTTRLGLPAQDLGLPSANVASLDCAIQIKDQSEWGDRALLEVRRGAQAWSMTVYAGAAATFAADGPRFIYSTYTEDCEEEGCDGHWYVSRELAVGDRLLEVSGTEPYSHRTSSITCILH